MEERRPTATAIILTYNRLPLLRRCVASALVQRDVDHEVLVIDNGTTDGTTEWLAAHTDTRLRTITLDQNRNPTQARNLGIDAARGDWVAFLDDDDLWAPSKLHAQLAAARKAGAVWSYTGCVYIDDDGQITAGRRPPPPEAVVRDLPSAYCVPGGLSSMAWDTRALGDDPHLDEALTYTDDWDMSLRLLRCGAPAFASQPLVAYRQHTASWSRKSDEQRHELAIIDRKHADVRRNVVVNHADHHRYVGAEALRAGARGEAVRHFATALRSGDTGALPRLVAACLPRRAQPVLRRTFLSDRRYMDDARPWIEALHAQPAANG